MINCDGLVKIYETDDKKVMALEGLDLTVETGEMLAVIGKSGSGNRGDACGNRKIRQRKIHPFKYDRRTGNSHSGSTHY